MSRVFEIDSLKKWRGEKCYSNGPGKKVFVETKVLDRPDLAILEPESATFLQQN
jgi:hypothetical protein